MRQSYRSGIFAMTLFIASCGAEPPQNLCEDNPECLAGRADALRPIDGDTFQLQGRRFRLIGYDSPETSPHAECIAEADLGDDTIVAVNEIFREADQVQILFRGVDEYGRGRAHVYLDGIHVGHLLEQRGLAKRWNEDMSEAKPSWCE